METHKNDSAPHGEPPKLESEPESEPESEIDNDTPSKPGREPKRVANNTRRLRMERMMSKAELARRAGVSTLTIDRIERGMNCRMDTKRKIIEALGLKPADRSLVFSDPPLSNDDDDTAAD